MVEFIDVTAEKAGTPLNRSNMMKMQGFIAATATINADGSITETNESGQTCTAKRNADGSITETFIGEKTITKKTSFGDGAITEVIE